MTPLARTCRTGWHRELRTEYITGTYTRDDLAAQLWPDLSAPNAWCCGPRESVGSHYYDYHHGWGARGFPSLAAAILHAETAIARARAAGWNESLVRP